MESDAIFQSADGRYALIEIKVGENAVPAAEENLLKFKSMIQAHNQKALSDPVHPRATYKDPSALIIICANATMAYTTKAGVHVIPIGCLRD